MDDVVITVNHEEENLKPSKFETKNLGNLKYFRRMEIALSKKEITMSQKKICN